MTRPRGKADLFRRLLVASFLLSGCGKGCSCEEKPEQSLSTPVDTSDLDPAREKPEHARAPEVSEGGGEQQASFHWHGKTWVISKTDGAWRHNNKQYESLAMVLHAITNRAQLSRRYKGKTYTVSLTASGFRYQSQYYESLTEVVEIITGYRQDGFQFFLEGEGLAVRGAGASTSGGCTKGQSRLGARCLSDCSCLSHECKWSRCVKRSKRLLAIGERCVKDGDCLSCECKGLRCVPCVHPKCRCQ